MRKIYNQCLNVSENNYKYLKLSRDRARGLSKKWRLLKLFKNNEKRYQKKF